MKITVAICTWNRSRQLSKTLENIRSLRIPTGVDWEVLVVDNNSTDNTQKVLADFASKLPLRSLMERRQGKSVACNRVIKQASGDFIVWTDDDIQPDVDWLQSLLDSFSKYSADIVFGQVKPYWVVGTPKWFSDRLNGKLALLDYGPDAHVVADRSKAFIGANYATRCDVFERLGEFHEDLGPKGNAGLDEDTDLFLRALDAGLTIVYEPKAVVSHMIGRNKCTKAFHRKRTWKSSATYFRSIQLAQKPVPHVFRLPRHLYRLAIDDVWAYTKALARRNQPAAFYHELRIIQFAGVLWQACIHRRGQRMPRNSQRNTANMDVTNADTMNRCS